MHWNEQGQSLTNAQAKPLAEKLYTELSAELHPTAVVKVLTNLERIHRRERKSAQVAYQLRTAGESPPAFEPSKK